MNGTSALQTRAILFTPPRITNCSQGANDDSGSPNGNAPRCLRKCGNGICLHGIADSERCASREEGKEDGQLLPPESTLKSIHRSTEHASVLRLDTVFYGEEALRVLRRNAEDARQPAPQHRTGTAEGNSRSDTDDVTGADSRCQSRRKGSELTDIAVRTAVALYA